LASLLIYSFKLVFEVLGENLLHLEIV